MISEVVFSGNSAAAKIILLGVAFSSTFLLLVAAAVSGIWIGELNLDPGRCGRKTYVKFYIREIYESESTKFEVEPQNLPILLL